MKTLIITLIICLLIYVLYIMLKIYNLKRKSKKLKIKYKEMGGVIKEEEIPTRNKDVKSTDWTNEDVRRQSDVDSRQKLFGIPLIPLSFLTDWTN